MSGKNKTSKLSEAELAKVSGGSKSIEDVTTMDLGSGRITKKPADDKVSEARLGSGRIVAQQGDGGI